MDVYGGHHDPLVFNLGETTPGTQRRETAEPRPVRDDRDDEKNRSIIRAKNQIPTVLSELTTAPVC
jgi:hypothetical protein